MNSIAWHGSSRVWPRVMRIQNFDIEGDAIYTDLNRHDTVISGGDRVLTCPSCSLQHPILLYRSQFLQLL